LNDTRGRKIIIIKLKFFMKRSSPVIIKNREIEKTEKSHITMRATSNKNHQRNHIVASSLNF